MAPGPSDSPRLGASLLAALGLAIVGSLLALFASEGKCGTTDGSFELDDPLAVPSGYCEALEFPGLPGSVGSWMLGIAIYLGPSLVVLCAALLARRTGKRGFLQWGGWLAFVWLVGAFAATLEAHVGYKGI